MEQVVFLYDPSLQRRLCHTQLIFPGRGTDDGPRLQEVIQSFLPMLSRWIGM
jgi:hypothetical protein